MATISEAFGNCPPDVAARQDLGEAMTIIRLRNYRDVKDVIEHAADDDPRKQAVAESREAEIWNEVMRMKKTEGVR